MQTINKPWGKEEILTIQHNYVVKRLFMRGGSRCSKQYHEEKTETIYILSGIMCLTMNDQIIEMQSGDYITIYPGTIHRMQGITDIVYLETSTIELDDVVRVEDDYDRK